VDTVFGRVTLHGTVRSAEEQAKAETIARQINGV
jgi:osmotically-inducible protein OsmY